MDRGLLLPGLQLVPLDPLDGAAVLAQAAACGVRQVWVGRTAMRAIGLPERLSLPETAEGELSRVGMPHRWVDGMQAAGWRPSTDPPGLAGWLGLSSGDCWVDLVVPAWDERNPFRSAPGSSALLLALSLFAQVVGLRYRRSPGATCMALMQQTDAFRGCAPPPPPAMQAMTAGVVSPWLQAPPAAGAGYLHGFDVNGMYLAAAGSDLGIGAASHHAGILTAPVRWPAYWHASISGSSSVAPLPFHVDGRLRWYVTSQLQLARELGLTVEVADVWTWPDRRRPLRAWYERLRDARYELAGRSPSADVLMCRSALKDVYTMGLGWLGGSWWPAGDPRFRPDWRESIIGTARARMARHILDVQRATGALPVIVARDDLAVWWSKSDDPVACAAHLGLPLGAQLGKWKWAGSAPARELHERLADPNPKARRQALDAVLSSLEMCVMPSTMEPTPS